jgi:hypothetical protein
VAAESGGELAGLADGVWAEEDALGGGEFEGHGGKFFSIIRYE